MNTDYQSLLYGETGTEEETQALLEEVLVGNSDSDSFSSFTTAIGEEGGTRRLRALETGTIESINSIPLIIDNIDNIVLIFNDDELQQQLDISNINEDTYNAINNGNLSNINVMLFTFFTSDNISNFIYHHHDKGEGQYYILKKLLDANILNSVLIRYNPN